ncbi:MAG: WD40 repeat domain-containing serine/threonine-protein kinase [Desulfurivibrio sp.]|nr:WD40 repeat domain-containing serine/threonine-protein kinase [Desulfurivibrio sp.]
MLNNLWQKIRPAGHEPKPAAEGQNAGEHGRRPAKDQQRPKRSALDEPGPNPQRRWQAGEVLLGNYLIEAVHPAPDGGCHYYCRHRGRRLPALLETPSPELLAADTGGRHVLERAELRIKLGMHPNLAATFNLRFTRKMPLVIGELAAGDTLAAWLTATHEINPRVGLSLAIQLCHGLEHCHRQGVIHGRLRPEVIVITPGSLLKVGGLGLAAADQAGVAADIQAVGHCLWRLFCANQPFADPTAQQAARPLPRGADITLPPALQLALVKSVMTRGKEGYQDGAQLRRDLNQAYRELFKITCPYLEPPGGDYRAAIFNNQAVMLLEEGKEDEARRKLNRSLELNDTLPTAIYNDLLLHWRKGRQHPAQILRRVRANQQAGERLPALLTLQKSLKLQLSGLQEDPAQDPEGGPDFQLILPPQDLKIYRHDAERRQMEQKIHEHLRQRRYQGCHDTLYQLWGREGYRKDRFCNQIYEELLQVREKLQPFAGQRFLKLSGHRAPVRGLACIPRSRRIVSLGEDGRIIIHDLAAGGKPQVAENHELAATALAVCPHGKHLAVGCADGSVQLLAPRSARVAGQEMNHRGRITALTFSPDGKLLAAAAEDGGLKVRRLATGREDAVSLADSGPVRGLHYPDDSLELLTGSDDGQLRHWKSRLRECLTTIDAHAGGVYALAAAPGLLISAGADRRIRLWQRPEHSCRQTLRGHGQRIRALLTMPDERTLVSAGDDDVLLLWDLASGQQLFSLDGRGGGIRSLAPGPRPHTLLAGRADGTINVWMLIYQLNFELL